MKTGSRPPFATKRPSKRKYGTKKAEFDIANSGYETNRQRLDDALRDAAMALLETVHLASSEAEFNSKRGRLDDVADRAKKEHGVNSSAMNEHLKKIRFQQQQIPSSFQFSFRGVRCQPKYNLTGLILKVTGGLVGSSSNNCERLFNITNVDTNGAFEHRFDTAKASLGWTDVVIDAASPDAFTIELVLMGYHDSEAGFFDPIFGSNKRELGKILLTPDVCSLTK